MEVGHYDRFPARQWPHAGIAPRPDLRKDRIIPSPPDDDARGDDDFGGFWTEERRLFDPANDPLNQPGARRRFSDAGESDDEAGSAGTGEDGPGGDGGDGADTDDDDVDVEEFPPTGQFLAVTPSGADEPTDYDARTDDDDVEDAKWGIGLDAPQTGTGAPPVVVVVIAKDPGSWFEESLESIRDQDYAGLSVLVIDNGGDVDLTERVAEVIPDAYVKHLAEDRGFSAAANEVLVTVKGAPFFLFLHDDVRLAPDVVTNLVAEAFRANAGVVAPKLVDWDHPEVLRSVGLAVDTYGTPSELVDFGELDQSQHDIARGVFAVSDACILVRADLFDSLNGFTTQIPFFGEDVDLCWRANVAGATVQFCPRAVVGHRGRFESRRPVESRSRLELRHQGRSLLTNYGLPRTLRMVITAAVASLVDFVVSLATARFRRCGDVVAAITWNVVHAPELLRARRRVRRVRRRSDADYLSLMRRGNTRLSTLFRSEEGESRVAAASRASGQYLKDLTTNPSRVATVLVVGTVAIIILGGRSLAFGALPAFREMFDSGGHSGPLVSQWWTGWRDSGLGEAAGAPTVVPGLGTIGWLLFGSVGLARRLLIILPLLIGAIGAWKLFAGARSIRTRSAAFAVYALSPIALNAMATGRLQALVTYAAAPWLLRRVAARSGVEPFGSPDERDRRPLMRHLAGNALILGMVAAVTPLGAAILAASLILLAIVALSVTRAGGLRMILATVGGLALASLVILPWLVAAVRHGDPATLTGVWETRAPLPSASEILTGSVGPVDVGLLGWGIVAAAALPIMTSRGWRFVWVIAGWVLTLAAWVATITLAQADLLGGAGSELFLVPAVLGLTLSAAMGPASFEHDVTTGDFGPAQVLSGLAVAALLIGIVPVALASANGRWYQPEGDFRAALDTVDRGQSFRTAWIGDSDVLPMSGWALDTATGLTVGIADGMYPTVTERYRLDGGPGGEQLRAAVDAALTGRTSRLGRLLAPMGIKYVMLVDRPAPEPYSRREVALPAGALASIQEQLDLSEVPLSPGAHLFQVAGTWPLRSDVTDKGIPADGAASLAVQAGLPSGAPPAVLGRGFGSSFDGKVPADGEIAQAVNADPAWTLEVDGGSAKRTDLFGWAQRFSTTEGGAATLGFDTPLNHRLLLAAQVLGTLLLLYLTLRTRRVARRTRQRRRHIAAEDALVVVEDDTEVHLEPVGGGSGSADGTVVRAGSAAAPPERPGSDRTIFDDPDERTVVDDPDEEVPAVRRRSSTRSRRRSSRPESDGGTDR